MEEYSIGDKVDSVAGIFKNGEVLDIKKESCMTILKIKWDNGLIQERATSIVRKA